MKERPILFSGPMVRALLDGSKKQTRRVVKHQPPDDVSPITVAHYEPTVVNWRGEEEPGSVIFGAYSDAGDWGCKCPYGEPGDRLWVRETWSADFAAHYPLDRFWYAADDDRKCDIEVRDGIRGIYSPESGEHVPFRWRPSIHMPRAASRITVEVTGVRVERLQDISEQDAAAEGVESLRNEGELWKHYIESTESCDALICLSARESFRTLWDSLAAPGADWQANPWVWVVEFKRAA